MTDLDALNTSLPLTVAEEIVAVEAGFGNWEYERRGVEFAQRLVRQAWGGIDFHVRDVDGNVTSFVQYRQPESSAG
jgi:hypothetical protein